ncbi:uncharacterized protein LTR77_001753 [Saxophila tyrrhenica]|uniref:Pentatricopeptide repeat protein n=1 Tax=Saxophila tyrrhenica TaxID=1690608 RepID=A0AAV9PPG9_9PEZI|nr:hypothetical protein LTR77_001753 [Saxophila tyrrhenica]
MFKPKTRPVPSPGALRVLTQLAYISSGTALGAAALCTEERRRRIKVVQRLADTARVIRQHPRYAGGVAFAREGGEEEGVMFRRRKRRRREGWGLEGEGVRGAELPSMVEAGYEETVEEGGNSWGLRDGKKRARGRNEARTAAAYTPFGASDMDVANASADHDAPSDGHRAERANSADQRIFAMSKDPSRALGSTHVLRDDAVSGTPDSYDQSRSQPSNIIFKHIRRKPNGFWTFERLGDMPPARLRPDQLSEEYQTRDAWRDLRGHSAESSRLLSSVAGLGPEHITHDVELFFAQESSNRPAPAILQSRADRADQLLLLAIRQGSLDDVRSLCLWMLGQGTFREWHSLLLATYYGTLVATGDQDEVLDFCLGVRSTSAYQRLSLAKQLEHSLLILANADTNASEELNIYKLADKVLGKAFKSCALQDVVDGVDSMCRSLVRSGNISIAAELFLTLWKKDRDLFSIHLTPKYFAAVADVVIDGGLSSGELSATGRLLRWKLTYDDHYSEQSIQYIKGFIAACGSRKMFSTLFDLFFSKRRIPIPMDVLKGFDEPNRILLVTAAMAEPDTETLQASWLPLRNSLSKPQQRAVRNASIRGELESLWHSTRDLRVVESKSLALQRQTKKQSTMLQIREAMLGIYINAGKVEEALALMSLLQKAEGLNSRTLRHAAHVFASSSRWDEVERITKLAERQELDGQDFDATAGWDRIVHLFAQEHTAEKTWAFVDSLTHATGFTPSTATAKIVLSSCITHQSLGLIPKWLAHLKTIGLQFDFDSKVVASMLTTYWIEHRPKHKRIMWICYFLHRHVSAFKAADFRGLMKAAIAYDLRNPFEQEFGMNNPREHASARLERVDKLPGHLAIPGWTKSFDDGIELSFSRGTGRFAGIRVRYTADSEEAEADSDSLFDAEGSDARSQEGLAAVIRQPDSGSSEVEANTSDSRAIETLSPTASDALNVAGDVRAKTEEFDLTSSGARTGSPTNRSELGHDRSGHETSVLSDHTESNAAAAESDPRGLLPADSFSQGSSVSKDKANNDSSSVDSTSMDIEEDYHAMIEQFNVDEGNAERPPNRKIHQSYQDEGLDNTNISFEQIRPNRDTYHSSSAVNELLDASNDQPSTGRIERELVVALSTGHYESALQLYEQNLDAKGLPLSVRSLEVAVEACIRFYQGNTTEAEALLDRASKAGFNVTCAMGPLIVARMRRMNKMQKRNANKLRMTVMDYYRMNDENGWKVSHHIATTAAHILISNNCPEHGVNLLAAIYKSEWAARRPLDAPAMTVFLMGYNDMRHLAGVKWVVDYVLQSGMRIARSFMRELKRSYQLPEDTPSTSRRVRERFTKPADRALLRSWAEECYTKRLQQIHDDYAFGLKLDWTIKKCAKQEGLAVLADYDEAYQMFVRGGLDPEEFDLEFLRKKDEVFEDRSGDVGISGVVQPDAEPNAPEEPFDEVVDNATFHDEEDTTAWEPSASTVEQHSSNHVPRASEREIEQAHAPPERPVEKMEEPPTPRSARNRPWFGRTERQETHIMPEGFGRREEAPAAASYTPFA